MVATAVKEAAAKEMGMMFSKTRRKVTIKQSALLPRYSGSAETRGGEPGLTRLGVFLDVPSANLGHLEPIRSRESIPCPPSA